METEYFVVHYREDRPPTPEELAALDRHFEVLAIGTMGVPESAGPIHVHLYRDWSDLEENGPCFHDRGACVIRGRIHTSVAVHRHDLIHTYLNAWCGRSIRLLSEGLAEALSRTSHYPLELQGYDLAGLTRSCAFRRADDESNISAATLAAGTLVAWLISEYGVSAVLDLTCSLGVDATSRRTERAFEEHLGSSLADLIQRAEDSSPARPTGPCPWDPERNRTLEFGEWAEVPIGPPLLLPEPIFVPPWAVYGHVRWASLLDGRGGLFQCGSPWGTDMLSRLTDMGEVWEPLDPEGRYLLDTDPFLEAAPGSVMVEVVSDAPLADVCDANVAVPFGAGVVQVTVASDGFGVDYPLLDVSGDAVVDASGQIVLEERSEITIPGQPRVELWVCPAGCTDFTPSGCSLLMRTADSQQRLVVVDAGTYTLVATWDEPGELGRHSFWVVITQDTGI